MESRQCANLELSSAYIDETNVKTLIKQLRNNEKPALNRVVLTLCRDSKTLQPLSSDGVKGKKKEKRTRSRRVFADFVAIFSQTAFFPSTRLKTCFYRIHRRQRNHQSTAPSISAQTAPGVSASPPRPPDPREPPRRGEWKQLSTFQIVFIYFGTAG